MGLPILSCPREKFELPTGEHVEIRGLSRAETLQIRALGTDVEAVEKACLRFALDATEADVGEWYATAPQAVVEDLVNAIARLSGLDPDEGKADAGASPSANGTGSTTSSRKRSARA